MGPASPMQVLIRHDAAMQVATMSAKRQIRSNISFGASAVTFSSCSPSFPDLAAQASSANFGGNARSVRAIPSRMNCFTSYR